MERAIKLQIAFVLGLGLTFALLWLLSSPSPTLPAAHAAELHVCSSGCSYSSIQAAVDAASDGDIIKVATGVYTDLSVRPRNDVTTTGVVTQIVYVTRTVTIQGGYTTTNWTTPYPVTQPTTLDAQGHGRVLYITGNISPTIQGLRITGGNAAAGSEWDSDRGSGVYIISSTTALYSNSIFSNAYALFGSGLYLHSSVSVLNHNFIYSNTARMGGGAYLYNSTVTGTDNRVYSNTADQGGGLHLDNSVATLNSNTIASNSADNGGGVSLWQSDATLDNNTIISNIATVYDGGGVDVTDSTATLIGNVIMSNTASEDGGGVYLVNGHSFLVQYPATFINNIIVANHADRGGGISGFYLPITLTGNTILSNTAKDGGGLYCQCRAIALNGNTISFNAADRDGGGLYDLIYLTSTITSNGNMISSNTANRDGGGVWLGGIIAHLAGDTITGNVAAETGGGVFLYGNTTVLTNVVLTRNSARNGGGLNAWIQDITLTNSVIADNQASSAGSGLYLYWRSRLYASHVTIARNNGGDGSGIYVTNYMGQYSAATMTNAILVSQTVGITATAGNTATLDGVLWFGNGANTGGDGLITVTHEITGNPAFAPDGYHLTARSAAIDQGVDAGVTTDIDGDHRPAGLAPDIGADEFPDALIVTKQADPNPVQAGSQLTYTLRVTNTGDVDLHATITDVLPVHVTPTGLLVWTPTIPAPSGVWSQTVVVTTEVGYSGSLTNVVYVTTTEGATGVYTATSQAHVTPMLQVTKQASNASLPAGSPLTYTIRVTNTGNVNLHAAVTDVLPIHVTPTGILAWTPTLPAPGGVWSQQIVVTTEVGYSGSLTNVVHVTTAEGATGVYTATSLAQVTPMLQVTKQASNASLLAGSPLTYTIRVTNTGNVNLHAIITDVLPAHVTPTGILAWTPTLTALGGVWSQTIVVTTEMGYTGTLTNTVHVTTMEGVTGTDSATVSVHGYKVYLPLMLRQSP